MIRDSLRGQLGRQLACVEDRAEHQDEQRVQEVQVVVKEDSRLNKKVIIRALEKRHLASSTMSWHLKLAHT